MTVEEARVIELKPEEWVNEQELRDLFQESMTKGDRVFLFSIRRDRGLTKTKMFMIHRRNCSVSWLEMLGALWVDIHRWALALPDEERE